MLDIEEIKPYLDKGYSQIQIASILGVTPSRVRYVLRKNGLSSRKIGSAEKTISKRHVVLGTRLNLLLAELGISNYELSIKSNVSYQKTSRFMKGIQDLSLMEIMKICDALGVELRDFLTGV